MDIIEAFGSKEDLIAGKGKSEADIRKAEEELGVLFAPDYRQYLNKYGLAMCKGHEFTGISKNDRVDVIKVTCEMRRFHPNISKDWYVIENGNMDGVVFWQDSQGNIYSNSKMIFSSFIEFVLDL